MEKPKALRVDIIDLRGCAARSAKQPTVMAQFGIFEVLNCSGEEKMHGGFTCEWGFSRKLFQVLTEDVVLLKCSVLLIESSRASTAWF